jgi:hypothetical protein
VAIPDETLAAWRADAVKRGGVPVESDPDPHVRYLANRIVAMVDELRARPGEGLDEDWFPPRIGCDR